MHKLEKLRLATYKVVEGERILFLLDKDDIEKVAMAIETSKSNAFGDEIRKNCTLTSGVLLVGMRLQLDYLSGSKAAAQ